MLQLAEGTGTGHSAWDLRPGPSVEMSFYQRLSAGYRQWHLLGSEASPGHISEQKFYCTSGSGSCSVSVSVAPLLFHS